MADFVKRVVNAFGGKCKTPENTLAASECKYNLPNPVMWVLICWNLSKVSVRRILSTKVKGFIGIYLSKVSVRRTMVDIR
jgi:hypothetical protein